LNPTKFNQLAGRRLFWDPAGRNGPFSCRHGDKMFSVKTNTTLIGQLFALISNLKSNFQPAEVGRWATEASNGLFSGFSAYKGQKAYNHQT